MRLLLVTCMLLFAGCLDNDGSNADNSETGEMNPAAEIDETLSFSDSGTILLPTNVQAPCTTVPNSSYTVGWEIPDRNGTFRDFEIALNHDSPIGDLDLEVSGPSGAKSVTTFDVTDGTRSVVMYSGIVSEGLYSITVGGCTGAAIDFTLEGIVDYFVPKPPAGDEGEIVAEATSEIEPQ